MELSKQEKLLSGPEIILRNLENERPEYVAYVAATAAAPNTEIVQVGNTAFITARAEGKHVDKMKGSMYNVDTSENLVKNITVYLDHIQKLNVRYYEVRFDKFSYVKAFRQVRNQVKAKGVSMNVGEKAKNSFVALITLSDTPIKTKGKK
tara:strand:- start:3423 stop:3872 length:450 start_codon:yes stop_codon:yes gene_type:complete